MADEEMRLVATFQDRIGPGLKGSIDKIRQFTKEGVRGSEEGEKSVKKHAKAFQELREKIKYTADLTREEFLPGLEKTALTAATAGIGLGTLTTAIGLAAAAARGFGETMAELQRGSRATGLSADDLRKWQNFGEIVGVTAEQMKTGLAGFNELVEKMQRRPDVFRQMFANFDMAGMAALRDFMLSLKDLPRDQQLDKVMEFIKTIKDVGQQKQVLKFLGLPPEIADDLQHYRENIDRAKASITSLSQTQIEQGAEAQKNWIELTQKFQDLSIVIGAKFSPAMSEATAELTAWITANQGAWSDNAAKWLKDTTAEAKEWVDWLQQIIDRLNAIAAWKPPKLFDLPEAMKEGAGKWDRNPDGSIKVIPSTPPPPTGQTPDDQRRREQFQKLNPGVLSPLPQKWNEPPSLGPGSVPSSLIHKSAFMVGGEEGGGGLSKGTSDMINIIAQGTRRGVYDGLMDFSQTPAGAGGGAGGGGGEGAGIIRASLGGAGAGLGAIRGGGARGGGAGTAGGALAGITTIGKGQSMVPGVSNEEMANEIRTQFAKRGIDPNVALALAKTEGAFAHRYMGDFNVGSPGWTSGGPFQLHHAPGGNALGDQFNRETGLRWDDPKTWKKQVEWVANFVAKRGSWGHDWATSMGKLGLSPGAGIGKPGQFPIPAPDQSAGPAKVGGSDPIDPGFLERFRQQMATPPAPHRYLSPFGNKPQEASLTRAARQANAGSAKVTGEASLSIKLAGGLAPDGGVKNTGDLFREIKISRGSVPYASTES